MKNALLLTLFAAYSLTFSACILQQQAGSMEQEWSENIQKSDQWAKEVQQAARECASMRWECRLSVYDAATDSYVDHKYTYPVSDAEAATIRSLLGNLHDVGYRTLEYIPEWGPPYTRCLLYFLDAEGNTIIAIVHDAIGADSHTDAEGCQVNCRLSLPDADYAEWQKLIPADLQRRYNQAEAQWKRRKR